MTYDQSLLSVKGLTVEYSSDRQVIHAVNSVSFSIKRGQTLGLVGETGAGKTTIAKAILGILPNPPAKLCAGEILFEGYDLLKKSNDEMRTIRGKQISMVFQDPMTALNPVKRVGDQIADVIILHEKVGKKEAAQKAREMLRLVGIPDTRYKEYPHQFSGGMKQRVIIAIALACNPKLLLADEPTSALDVTIQAQVLDLINDLKEKQGTSMILITHDLGIVAQICDVVAVAYAGRIVEYGTLEDVFDHPQHPYTRGLFKAIPDIKQKSNRLHPIQGMPPDPSSLPGGCAFAPRCPDAMGQCRTCKPENVCLSGSHFCCCLRCAEH